MTAITLQDVTMRFGELEALSGVCLDIQEGEFVSLVGASGCGKTTLLRLIAGLENANQGKVLVNGKNPKITQQKHDIGIAFQKPALIPSRTALSNVKLTLEVAQVEFHFDPQELLEAFGLGKFINHYPRQLSGGMQQRVNIACAMVHNPSVLLLDEPFGALDEFTREEMGEWLSQILANTPKTVVFVTHSLDEAVLLSDRVFLMSPHPGKIVEEFSINLDRPRRRIIKTTLEYSQEVATIRRKFYEVIKADGGGK